MTRTGSDIFLAAAPAIFRFGGACQKGNSVAIRRRVGISVDTPSVTRILAAKRSVRVAIECLYPLLAFTDAVEVQFSRHHKRRTSGSRPKDRCFGCQNCPAARRYFRRDCRPAGLLIIKLKGDARTSEGIGNSFQNVARPSYPCCSFRQHN
jgi:hypothetical protein